MRVIHCESYLAKLLSEHIYVIESNRIWWNYSRVNITYYIVRTYYIPLSYAACTPTAQFPCVVSAYTHFETIKW